MKKSLFILLAAMLAAAAFAVYDAFYGNAVREEYTLYVYEDTGYESLRSEIAGCVAPMWAFDLYAGRISLPERFRRGRYTVREGMSVIRIARMLKLGEQSPVRLVVGEARTLPQLAGKIASQIEADSMSVLAAMRDKALKKELGYVRDSLVAMFVPDTYEVWWNVAPETLLRRLKRESDAFWSGAREEKLRRAGLSRYEAMTLASIVYEETKNRAEMPKIAGVYMNRLRRGMALQACPTVKYAMGRFDLTRVLHEHLRYRSPFNTYLNAGLPPAPICVPSIAAIDAVLDYEKSGFLYFCARPELDGTHNFARTLREHNANAKKYSEALARYKNK